MSQGNEKSSEPIVQSLDDVTAEFKELRSRAAELASQIRQLGDKIEIRRKLIDSQKSPKISEDNPIDDNNNNR